MNELAEKKCPPCDEATKPLDAKAVTPLLQKLGAGWQVANGHHLEKTFKFPDFKQALAFTNKIGEIAESIGHHPDIYLTWGKVRLEIFTHKVNGLTENDFVLAAKFEAAQQK
jgi:4a-hydroxytetrahydrobiopterin dehydratase